MCERDKRKGDCTLHVYTHTHTHILTACSLRHGRHGGLTHIRLEHRAGPGPRTRYHGSLSPHKPRPPPPSEFISKQRSFYAVMAQSLETWFTLSLTLYYVVTSPPLLHLLHLLLLPSSSSSCERLKMPLIPLCRLGTLLGSKGEGVRHSQPLVYIGPDHEMMALS